MELQADIKWIIAELKGLKDPELIEVFKNLLRYRKRVEQHDWWETISDAEKAEIDSGLKQFTKGEVLSHDEVMKDPRKWK